MADYLVHFNKNHDSRNGQFTFGDGDGDGKREYQTRLKGVVSESKATRMKPKQGKDGEYQKAKARTFKIKPDNFRDSEGNYDFDAQTRAGVKRLILGAGSIGVGALLTNSGNNIAIGAGYVAEIVGAGLVGSGAGQIVGSRINKKYADPKLYPQVKNK